MERQKTMRDEPEHYVDPARSADEARHHAGIARIGLVLPTREDIASCPPADLEVWLDLWFFESPTLLVPSDSVVLSVREDLLRRPDAESQGVRSLIELCDAYISPG